MDIKTQGAKFFQIYADDKDYYMKNQHGNILEVTKGILMEKLGYIFLRVKDSITEDNVGRWQKKLPAEEGVEWVTKKDWQDLENQRLEIVPAPVEKPKEEIKMGPDEGRFNSPADLEAEARAEAEAKAKADEEAANAAEAEAKANAEGGEGEN